MSISCMSICDLEIPGQKRLICKQWRPDQTPHSVASALADQGFPCQLEELMDTIECINEEPRSRRYVAHAQGDLHAPFAHFVLRGPNDPYTCIFNHMRTVFDQYMPSVP